MGNYYSYDLVGNKPSKLPKVYFAERCSIERLIEHGWVESKRWDMVADIP